MYTNTASWTTARGFELDPVIAVSNTRKFTPVTIPQYTYKHSVNNAQRRRPRCEDLEMVVKIPNMPPGGID